MIDLKKIKRAKYFAVFGLCLAIPAILLFLFLNKQGTPSADVAPGNGEVLNRAYVEKFLKAYYTKEKLSANRKDYKPFLTKAAYTQEVNREEEPLPQGHKEYVVDYEYQDAQIYIDSRNQTAIAEVTYTNTLLAKANDYASASTNVVTNSTLKLTYKEVNNHLKIDRLEVIKIFNESELSALNGQ